MKLNNVNEGIVYVISNKAWEGMYKVGITSDPDRRLKQYQTYSPHRDYIMEYVINTKFPKNIERIIHSRYNSRDEWVCGNLDDIIRDIKEQFNRYNKFD